MHQREPRFSPRVVDAAVVGAVALPGILGLVLLVAVGEGARVDLPLAALPLAIQAGALWWRRRHPLGVLAVTLAALLAAQALGDLNASSFVGVHAAAYAVGTYGDRRAVIAGLVAIGVAAILDVVVVELVPIGLSHSAVGPNFALAAIAWGIGRYVRVRRDHLDTLVAYAHQLEVDRDEKVHRAVLEERRRIARELHDQVAHHLGVAALQTGAARAWVERDPARASEAMASAEDAVRAALTTMPVILEALRADGVADEVAPQPTLADLEELVARVSQVGLAVDLLVEADVEAVPPAVAVTAYRIVQEALTNTMKHAGASGATVQLRADAGLLDVEVTDDGRGEGSSAEGAGLGLVGMGERVEILGGELEAGPRDGGGFTVRARLPLTPRDSGGSPPQPRGGRILR